MLSLFVYLLCRWVMARFYVLIMFYGLIMFYVLIMFPHCYLLPSISCLSGRSISHLVICKKAKEEENMMMKTERLEIENMRSKKKGWVDVDKREKKGVGFCCLQIERKWCIASLFLYGYLFHYFQPWNDYCLSLLMSILGSS